MMANMGKPKRVRTVEPVKEQPVPTPVPEKQVPVPA